MESIIDGGELTPEVKSLAKRIFRIVAEAESQAHGLPLEEVHFHEVGAVDSIVDIVAAAYCLDSLGIRRCVVTGMTEGTGFVTCQHGDLPVPVPAVLSIASRFAIPLRRASDIHGEMVTPTGIAIAAAIMTDQELPQEYVVQKVGIGLGKRDFGRPNLLRAMMIRESSRREAGNSQPLTSAPFPVPGNTLENSTCTDGIIVLESNIDDATGEELGLTMEILLQAGARDVHYMPCFMKKNRPGWLLRVLTDESRVKDMERLIFLHTTTIGIRRLPAERSCMVRRTTTVEVDGGTVSVKVCSWDDLTRFYPEYESVRAISQRTGRSYREVYAEAVAVAQSFPKNRDSSH